MGWTHRAVRGTTPPSGICDALNALADRQLDTARNMMSYRAQADLHARILAETHPELVAALAGLDDWAREAARDWARSVARQRRHSPAAQ